MVDIDRATWIAALIAVLSSFYFIYNKLFPREPVDPFLKPTVFQPLTLALRRELTKNTFLFRFVLPCEKQAIGLPTGQHITFLAKDSDGKEIYRPYTPVTDDKTLGQVDFIIKLYPEGKMSKILSEMKCGSQMLMKGPKGRFTYEANKYKNIGMIAGGTGITPMYQVINAILVNPLDTTLISLVYGSITVDDIILKQELDTLSVVYGDRFKIFYVLNNPPKGWNGGSGFVTREMLKENLPAPGENTIVLRCGPTPMMKALEGHLNDLGYGSESVFQF